MFLPRPFRLDDEEAIAALMAERSFALLVTVGPDGPEASPLPLLHRPAEGRLLGHLSAANPQAATLRRLAESGEPALVVYSGPHAYVSPSNYHPGPAVPTWNYLSAQVRGRVSLLDEGETAALLEALVETYEAGRAQPWSMAGQDPDYLDRMRRGVLAFAIATDVVEGKAKLSQNRPPEDRVSVAAGLAAEPDAEAQATAAWMRRLGVV